MNEIKLLNLASRPQWLTTNHTTNSVERAGLEEAA